MSTDTTFYALLAESMGGDMRVEGHISESDFDRYRHGIRQIDHLRMQQQYALIERNFNKLRQTRSYFALGFGEGILDSHSHDNAMFAYNSDLVNWLASVRLFLDHMELRPESDELRERFTRSKNEEHHGSRAYRILYKMRDYTLHCDFPITALSIELEDDSAGNRSENVSVRFLVDRKMLLTAHFDWKKVKRDIEVQPETFELDSMTEEFMDRLRRIYWRLINEEVTLAASAYDTLKEAFDRFPERPSHPVRSIAAVQVTSDSQGPLHHYRRTRIPFEFAQLVVAAAAGEVEPSNFIRAMAAKEVVHEEIADERFKSELRMGVGVMTAYLELDFGPELARRVNSLLDDRGVVPAFQGTVSVAYLALQMVAAMHGASATDVLGRIAMQAK